MTVTIPRNTVLSRIGLVVLRIVDEGNKVRVGTGHVKIVDVGLTTQLRIPKPASALSLRAVRRN